MPYLSSHFLPLLDSCPIGWTLLMGRVIEIECVKTLRFCLMNARLPTTPTWRHRPPRVLHIFGSVSKHVAHPGRWELRITVRSRTVDDFWIEHNHLGEIAALKTSSKCFSSRVECPGPQRHILAPCNLAVRKFLVRAASPGVPESEHDQLESGLWSPPR